MLQAIALVLAGLVVLTLGAEMIVRGGSALAARLGVSPLIIGLTFVAIGTSAPELGIGIEAARNDQGSLAVGNIVGTNTVNILLIMGLSAALRPLALQVQTLRRELPAIVVASLVLAFLARDGLLTILDGVVLLVLGAAFTWAVTRSALRESFAAKRAFSGGLGLSRPRTSSTGAWKEVLALAGGIAIIVSGAHVLIEGAVALARFWKVSDAFIGLTVVAIGTSAPELVTTIISTLRGNRDIAIGNLIGSSVYNIVVILGITCLASAIPLAVDDALIRFDIPVMIGVALVCLPVFLTGRRVSRGEGLMFVLAYVAYLGYLLADRT